MNTEGDEALQQKEDALQTACNDLDVDYADVTEKMELSPQFSSDAKDAMVQIQNVAEDYEMLLNGRRLESNGSGKVYVQKSKALAGSKFIKLSGGILRSMADNTNLIGAKKEEYFNMQYIDAFNKVSSAIMRDRTVSEKNHKAILKIFKDRYANIGDIITNTDGNMGKIFSKDPVEQESQQRMPGDL